MGCRQLDMTEYGFWEYLVQGEDWVGGLTSFRRPAEVNMISRHELL